MRFIKTKPINDRVDLVIAVVDYGRNLEAPSGFIAPVGLDLSVAKAGMYLFDGKLIGELDGALLQRKTDVRAEPELSVKNGFSNLATLRAPTIAEFSKLPEGVRPKSARLPRPSRSDFFDETFSVNPDRVEKLVGKPLVHGTPKYSISIVVYNNLHLTKRCIESVFKHSHDFELIVTDNASTDGTDTYLNSIQGVRVVTNDRNLGFGIPHNGALPSARGEFFVVLNNDTEVCPEWLDLMSGEFLKNPNLAICGVKGTCSEVGDSGNGFVSDTVEYVEASCMMGRRSVFDKHGLFSDTFKFASCEDSDLSFRMRELGYDLILIPIPVVHLVGATEKIVRGFIDIDGYHFYNQKMLLKKWRDYFKWRRKEKKIVVRRNGGIGDVLMATPIVRALRLQHPLAWIGVETEYPDVFYGNPDVDAVSKFEFLGKFDVVYNLNMAYESASSDTEHSKHIIQAYADKCGLNVPDWDLRLYPNEDYVAEVLRSIPAGVMCVIHPGPTSFSERWVGRQWGVSKFDAVARYLMSNGIFVVLVGTTQTPTIACDFDARGQSYSYLIALMKCSDLFVGLDSSPFHVAQAFKKPAVVIFGSVDPKYRIVPGSGSVAVTAASVACTGCHNYLPPPRVWTPICERGCAQGAELCMEKLSVQQVIDEIENILLRIPARG